MNILHVNSNIASRSGVMRVLMNYHRSLNENDVVRFDYAYYRPTQNSFEAEIVKLGGHAYKLSSPKRPFLFMRDLERLMNDSRCQYDVVHLHDPSLVRLIAPIVRKGQGCKFVVHSHATAYSDSKLGSIRNHLLCLHIAQQADALFACSEAAGRFLFGAAPFHVVQNAIDTASFGFDGKRRSAAREALGLSDDDFVVGHVGSFVAQKNHRFLVDIFSHVKKELASSKLLLVGDGPLMSSVREDVSVKGLERDVIFVGPRDDVPQLYQAMDVFVLPSLYEGLPMVGIEAQCSGLPVIFSGEITKEVGVEGSLFLGLDRPASEWARKIVEIGKTKNGAREEGVARVAAGGFDIEREAQGLLDAYNWLISA